GHRGGHPGVRILPPKSRRRTEVGGNSFRLGNPDGLSRRKVAAQARGFAGDRCSRSRDRSVVPLRAAAGHSFTCANRCPARVEAEPKEGLRSDVLQLSDGCESILGGIGRTVNQARKQEPAADSNLYGLDSSTRECRLRRPGFAWPVDESLRNSTPPPS